MDAMGGRAGAGDGDPWTAVTSPCLYCACNCFHVLSGLRRFFKSYRGLKRFAGGTGEPTPWF